MLKTTEQQDWHARVNCENPFQCSVQANSKDEAKQKHEGYRGYAGQGPSKLLASAALVVVPTRICLQ
jgi:hypothetical protein